MMIQGIIFDLDGTLADTFPLIFEAFRHCFSKDGEEPYTDEQISQLFGPSEEGIFKRITPQKWQDYFQKYLEFYQLKHELLVKQPDEVIPLLMGLQERAVRLGIVTGKGSRSAEITLAKLGLSQYFTQVKCGSELGAFKPQGIQEVLEAWGLEPARAAYVGDSPSDMVSATQAGVIALGAAWYNSDSELIQKLFDSGAVQVFTSPSLLLDWLEKEKVAPK